MKQVILLAAGLVWLVAVGTGLAAMWKYENAPGEWAHGAPSVWPADSTLARVSGRATLVIAVHPHCPCSRATIGELALIMTRVQGLATVHVVFFRPLPSAENWHETALWRAAAEIPGVVVTADPDGLEAHRFGAITSGQTLLYDTDAALRFNGGITASRGHSGDNAGRAAVVSLLLNGHAERHSTFVFGCYLSHAPRAAVGRR